MAEKQLAFSTSDTANKTIQVTGSITITAAAAGTLYSVTGTFARPFAVTPDVVGHNVEGGKVLPIGVQASPTGYTISVVTITGSGYADGNLAAVSATFKGPIS